MENLLSNIRNTLEGGATGFEESVRSHMCSYIQQGNKDWHQYRLFAPLKYARNLVDINLQFEAIVICWDENQESPIHNHTAQNCWFAVLEGNVEEIYYSFNEQTKQITEGTKQSLSCGQVGWIKDDIALHKVRSVGGRACTLHIYSKPIPYCNIYDPATGDVIQRKCGFYSVRGLKQCTEGTSQYQELYRILEEELASKASLSLSVPPTALSTLVIPLTNATTISQSTQSSIAVGSLTGSPFVTTTFSSGSIMSMLSSHNTGGNGSKEEFCAW
eukprot:TRINITY_DN8522_c0_g1_i1.p1 TRINITY_DN8522_c0_g1~~TRINITY_DN8522_c0_g1_i1.p1  ORF type:complete len:273 (+),score=44.03 TRINITY_DN8522_c0_g1_i1:68-886(+)